MLSSVDLSSREIDAIIGFHAFFRKGKIICWKKLKKKLNFTAAFKSLSSDWYFEESTFNNLEEYVCMLYGQNNKDINAARSNMFLQKYSSISKVIDLAVLLPCRSVLYLRGRKFGGKKIWRIWRIC